MLTSRERLRRCYYHEEMDRPAVYSRTGFPPNDPGYDSLKKLLEEKTDLKFKWVPELSKPQIAVSEEPYSDEFMRRTKRMQTPKGELSIIELIGLKNQPGMVEKHLLETREDIERYLSLPMPEINDDFKSFFELDRKVGDRGIVDVYLIFNPAGHVVELFGSENFAMMSFTNRDILYTLCDRKMQETLMVLDKLIDAGVGPFFSMLGEEYLVPPMHSPKDFFDFNVKYDKPIIDRIHESGGRIHIHSHGSIKTVLDGFVEMGADVLHPFEAPPMGDITAAEAKEVVRGKICIEGNIQIADMYEKSPDNIREQTQKLIADAFDDRRGLIVSPSASPYIPGEGEKCYEQYRAMIEAVTRWSNK
jgi:uroporphyrinogen decarboxylase-like protein